MIDHTKLNQFAGVIAADLTDAERSIDESIAKASILLTTLVSGRMEAGLPAQTGHQAVAKLGDAITSAIAFRGSVVGAHRSLEAVAVSLGANWNAGGPLEPKPDDGSKHKPLRMEQVA